VEPRAAEALSLLLSAMGCCAPEASDTFAAALQLVHGSSPAAQVPSYPAAQLPPATPSYPAAHNGSPGGHGPRRGRRGLWAAIFPGDLAGYELLALLVAALPCPPESARRLGGGEGALRGSGGHARPAAAAGSAAGVGSGAAPHAPAGPACCGRGADPLPPVMVSGGARGGSGRHGCSAWSAGGGSGAACEPSMGFHVWRPLLPRFHPCAQGRESHHARDHSRQPGVRTASRGGWRLALYAPLLRLRSSPAAGTAAQGVAVLAGGGVRLYGVRVYWQAPPRQQWWPARVLLRRLWINRAMPIWQLLGHFRPDVPFHRMLKDFVILRLLPDIMFLPMGFFFLLVDRLKAGEYTTTSTAATATTAIDGRPPAALISFFAMCFPATGALLTALSGGEDLACGRQAWRAGPVQRPRATCPGRCGQALRPTSCWGYGS
jgi:hypothetical protein